MNTRRIFCFWEPRDAMPSYLQLCMRSWTSKLPDYEIVVLDHSNLDEWLAPGTYDMAALGRFGLPAQKDAILAAVLSQHGGIFMDVDKLVTGDISPIVQRLERSEVLMFNLHVAFVAARPGARLLALWTRGVQDRLARLGEGEPGAAASAWDYLGNGVLDDEMTHMVGNSCVGRAYRGIERRQASWPFGARRAWQRVCAPIWARRKGLFFRSIYGRYLRMLDRERHGFIVEAAVHGRTAMSPAERYRRFWFEDGLDVGKVFSAGQRLIGLHHSWTPGWFAALSEDEVLANGCLLSRTLRHVLAESC